MKAPRERRRWLARALSALSPLAFALATWLGAPGVAMAQPMGMPAGPGGMPDLRIMNGKSRPDPSDPAGQVTVRVVRKTFASPAAGIEVILLGKNAGGDVRKRTAKTNDAGRAVFDAVAPGSTVTVEATVDGERIVSEPFTSPSGAGVRTLLVAGVGAAPSGGPSAGNGAGPSGSDNGNGPSPGGEGQENGEGGEGAKGAGFSLGVTTGTSHIDPSLPPKTLVVKALDRAGKPLAGQLIELGQVTNVAGSKVQILPKTTNADGIASYSDLPTGEQVGYAAVMSHDGLRIGTDAFAMPETGGGVVAELRMVGRTNDPSVISIGEGARIVLEVTDDVVQILEFLPLVNNGPDIYDGEPGGFAIPLPREFTSAEGAQGDTPIETRKGFGVSAHVTVPPGPPTPMGQKGHPPNEVRFAFVVPFHSSTLNIEQPLPAGMGPFTFIAQKIGDINVESSVFQGPRTEKMISNHPFWVWPASAIPRGGSLQLHITGLPAHDRPGRTVAAIMACLLVVAAIALSWGRGGKPKGEADPAADLTAERERLFEELLAVERKKELGAATAEDAARRRELVAELENVLRELANPGPRSAA